MIETRIATAAAAILFGLAAVGGTAVTTAVPAHAAPTHQHSVGSKSPSAGPARGSEKESSGSARISATAPQSDRQNDGPAVPRDWYPVMPDQHG